MVEIDKLALLEALKQRLQAELERARNRARDAAEGATHEENRAEGDKDMRATEASYIARGHSGRAAELEEALARLSTLDVTASRGGSRGGRTRVVTSAVVEVAHEGKRLFYFLVPAAGGERITFAGAEVQTITPSSPLGAAVMGLTEGDQAELPARGPGQRERIYSILKVH